MITWPFSLLHWLCGLPILKALVSLMINFRFCLFCVLYNLSPQNTSNPNFQCFNPNFYWSSSCLVGQIMSSSCEVKTQVQVKSSFAGVRSLPSMKSSAFSHVHCLIPSLYMCVYVCICLYHCWFTYANVKNSYSTVYNTLQRIGRNMASSYAVFCFAWV